MLQILGIGSGVICFFGYVPYLRDIFRGTTKPERASWFIWLVLGIIGFFSQRAEGATWSLWLSGVNNIGILVIVILSIKYGVGGMRKRDVLALAAAAVGLYLWYLTRHAYIALYITLFIDALGYILIYMKSYSDPGSETLIAWVIYSLAGLAAALSIGTFNPVLLSYPVYVFVVNMIVVLILLSRKQKITK